MCLPAFCAPAIRVNIARPRAVPGVTITGNDLFSHHHDVMLPPLPVIADHERLIARLTHDLTTNGGGAGVTLDSEHAARHEQVQMHAPGISRQIDCYHARIAPLSHCPRHTEFLMTMSYASPHQRHTGPLSAM